MLRPGGSQNRGTVALRKESVDRNIQINNTPKTRKKSLSARRAWIEITVVGVLATLVTASLSARRAWIEITQFVPITTSDVVALRKESVDRNGNHTGINLALGGRSPQGERG